MTSLGASFSPRANFAKPTHGFKSSNLSSVVSGFTTAEKLRNQRSIFDRVKESASALDSITPQTEDAPGGLGVAWKKLTNINSGGHFWSSPISSPTGIEVNLVDPSALSRHDNTTQEWRDTDGEIFVDGVSADDVKQGAINDGYLMTALASLAQTNPDFIENMIVENGNGTFTINFASPLGSQTVDDDLLFTVGGEITYASIGDSGEPQELWVAIVQKAYAQAKGDYNDIEFGWARNALAEIAGNSDFTAVASREMDFATIEQALNENRPANAATFGDGKKTYENGLVGNHSYTFLDTRVNDEGVEQVQLRNPWGVGEIAGNGPNDGVF